MRSKRLRYNTISSFFFQVTTIICGFVLPRLILKAYGSDVNGLVDSITQFLGVISFLELGVGAVVQSALYKPLADGDNETISKVIISAGKFFNRLAQALLVYVIILVLVYPHISHQKFGWVYTATLIGTISISSFAQYYFGMVDRLLLTADQRGYIQYNAQTVTLIINTIVCVALIYAKMSIHVVKLVTSLIYILRPIFLRLYVDKNYHLNRYITYNEEPIKQKWNGVAQHVAAVVLDGTDSIILTVFSSLANVSIYSIYNLVVAGIKRLLTSMTNGMQALIGELWAKQELVELKRIFSWFEWFIHTGTVFVFGCTGRLILPFVQLYTNGITDANYYQPLFAILIVTAHAGHCLRLPYNIMILAGGHYKQTQRNYVVSAVLNIVISVIAVNFGGLIGVAIGTLVAMLYQTIWMAIYDSKYLVKWPIKNFIKQICVDLVTVTISAFVSNLFDLFSFTYLAWAGLAVKVFAVYFIFIILINFVFYRDKMIRLFDWLLHRIKQ